MNFRSKLLVALALALGAASVQATVIFSDDFNANPNALNAVPAGWTVQNGTVDIVGGGFCLDGSAACIDLDGSTADAGELSHEFSMEAGILYTLSYQLSGNRRIGSDTVTVLLGTANQSHTLAFTDPLQTFTLDFLATSTGIGLFTFANLGGDNIGLLLDNVVLSSGEITVPEPSGLMLLSLGLAGLALTRRHHRLAARR